MGIFNKGVRLQNRANRVAARDSNKAMRDLLTSTEGSGFNLDLNKPAIQAGAYGIASGVIKTLPSLLAKNSLKQEGAEVTSFDRYGVPELLTPELLSETSATGLIDSMTNKGTQDIINASNGSAGTVRTNLLANNLNIAKAKSATITDLIQRNNAEKARVKSYNAQALTQMDQRNTQISNEEIIANEQNQAAYDNQINTYNNTISQGVASGVDDFGTILQKMLETGYGLNGKKFKTEEELG